MKLSEVELLERARELANKIFPLFSGEAVVVAFTSLSMVMFNIIETEYDKLNEDEKYIINKALSVVNKLMIEKVISV